MLQKVKRWFSSAGRDAELEARLAELRQQVPVPVFWLFGKTQSGKTSIIRLLLRLMDVDGGRILVGGRDITRLTQADLRSLIAYVPQDPVMFHRTLGENIAFGRPDATGAQIRAAAEAAHVLEFADALPQGFEPA